MRRLFAITLTIVLTLGLVAPTSAGARPSEQLRGRPLLLALGDSVVAGEGSHPDRAMWSETGFVPMLTEELQQELGCLPAASADAASRCPNLTVVNLGRPAEPTLGLPGVTALAVIEEQLPRATELLRARNGNANPRDDVEVVVLSVGGNELFATAGQYCLDPAGPTADCLPQIAQLFGTYAGQLGTILQAVRAAGGPGVRIAVMTYYNPLPYCPIGDPLGLGSLVLEGDPASGQPGFNDVIRAVAGPFGAVTAEVYGVLGDGDFADCKHPSATGHAKVADAFARALIPR